MIDTCEYHALLMVNGAPKRGPVVRGFQIGRFAVRCRSTDVDFVKGSDGSGDRCRDFIVDHIGTGAAVVDLSRFDDAIAFADDMSRFADPDPDASGPIALRRQIGPVLCGWAETCRERDTFIPLRDHLGIARLQRQEVTS